MQELRIKATSNEALHGIGVMLTPPRELVRYGETNEDNCFCRNSDLNPG